MWSLLSKERKILVGVTVVVFLISATLIWQTFQTMQVFNQADAICQGAANGMSRDELKRYANSQRTSIVFLDNSTTNETATLGFSSLDKESCGCDITLSNNVVSNRSDTYCKTSG